MRKHYIDNIRIICILLLFPFHTARTFNDYGELWYVQGKPMLGADLFVFATYPWWMSLLFVLAGISTVYALQYRTGKEYFIERVRKLLIPCISAILFIIPVQAYIADIFYAGYAGSYLSHFKEYFCITDWNGADGHFTPGNIWFILYLFIICSVTLPLILWYQKKEKKIDGKKVTIPKLLPLFAVILLSALILDIGGKSIGEYMACFLIGYFLLSIDEVQERLVKNRFYLGAAWFVLMLLRCWICYRYHHWNTQWSIDKNTFGLIADIQSRLYAWIGILAFLGLGKKYLNFNNKVTQYFSSAAFSLYLFHQSAIVIVGYFMVNKMVFAPLEYLTIMLLSFGVSVGCYELCSRIGVTRFLFGIKKRK